ncbi:MAG: nucleotidyltransferase domain-containing protein [Candidatus Woesearchaeota archaeon]
MLVEFKKYQGINVLTFFLENPDLEVHIKDLARKLKISPATSKKFCDLLNKEQLILKEKKGNTIFFKLNNQSNYVKLLKKTHGLMKIKKHWESPLEEGIKTIAVYGSYASGEYSQNSDLDLIIITRKKDVNLKFIQTFQNKIKKEVNITKLTYFEWEKLKKDNDAFAKELILNNFVILGSEL